MVYILSSTLEEHFKPIFIFYLRYEPALEPKNIVFVLFFIEKSNSSAGSYSI